MLSPRAKQIADAAEALLDEEGPEALTMRRLADRLGIKAASLYKHFAGKDEIEAELISRSFETQAEVFEQAVAGAAPARELEAVAGAYRSFARERPHRYRLMTGSGLRRDLLRPGVEDRAAAPLIGIFGGDRDRARAAWAFAHGMTILELDRRLPSDADLDAAWRSGVAALEP